MSELKITGENYKLVWYQDYNDLVNKYIKFPNEYNCQRPGAEKNTPSEYIDYKGQDSYIECPNIKDLTINKEWGEDYVFNPEDITEGEEEIMNELCRLGVIDPGNYIINVWW